VAVARQAEQDGLALAFGLAAQGLVDGAADGVGGFRRRNDALARANITPASKQAVWCTPLASIRPSSFTWLTSGAMPW
jgi:hypothetical protein